MKIELDIHYGDFSSLTFINRNSDNMILFYLDDAVITNCEINRKRFNKFLSLPLFYEEP
jgi:hypothetical protein